MDSSYKNIPVSIDTNLIKLFFIDMIHDFSPNNLTGNFEQDLKLLNLMFDSVFGVDSVKDLLTYLDTYLQSKGLKKNDNNWIHAAHRWAYLTCMSNGKFFFNDPSRDISGKTNISVCDNLEKLLQGGIITQAEADWESLHSGKFFNDSFNNRGKVSSSFTDSEGNVGNAIIPKPIFLIEDSSKGIRRIPLLFSEVFNTLSKSGNNPRHVINLETVAGIYDEASSSLAVGNHLAYVNSYFSNLTPKKGCIELFRDIPINFQLYGSRGEQIVDAKLEVNTDNSNLNVIILGFKILFGLYNFILTRTKQVYSLMKVALLQPEKIAEIEETLKKKYSDDNINFFKSNAEAFRDSTELFLTIQGFHFSIILFWFLSADSQLKLWLDHNYDKPGSATVLLELINTFDQGNIEALITAFVSKGDADVIFQAEKEKNPTLINYNTTLQDVFSDVERYYYGNPSKTVMTKDATDKTVKYNNSRRIGPILFNQIMDVIIEEVGETEYFTSFLKDNKKQIIELIKTKFSIFSKIFNETGLFDNSTLSVPKDVLSTINKQIKCGTTGCPQFQSLLTGMSAGNTKGEKPTFSLGDTFLNRLSERYEPNTETKKTFFSLLATFSFFDFPFSYLKAGDITDSSFLNEWFTSTPDSVAELISSSDSSFLIYESLKRIHDTKIDTQEFKKYASLTFESPDGIVKTEPTQNPSVLRIAENFRLKLFNQTLQQMKNKGHEESFTIYSKRKTNLVFDTERFSQIPQTAQETILDLIKWNVTNVEKEEQDKLWKTLFFTLFKKTMSDFLQIVLAKDLSTSPICNTNNFSNIIWLISQDISMTFISLYYGANILQIRIDESQPMSKGTVNYGFGNSDSYKTLYDLNHPVIKAQRLLGEPTYIETEEEKGGYLINMPLKDYNELKPFISASEDGAALLSEMQDEKLPETTVVEPNSASDSISASASASASESDPLMELTSDSVSASASNSAFEPVEDSKDVSIADLVPEAPEGLIPIYEYNSL